MSWGAGAGKQQRLEFAVDQVFRKRPGKASGLGAVSVLQNGGATQLACGSPRRARSSRAQAVAGALLASFALSNVSLALPSFGAPGRGNTGTTQTPGKCLIALRENLIAFEWSTQIEPEVDSVRTLAHLTR